MPVYGISGSTLEIGAVVATKAADFIASDFTTPLTDADEVKEPETFGAIADTWEGEDFTNATDGRTRVVKTVRKGAVVEFVHGLDPTDAGQLAMRAAFAARDNYAFRFTLADKPSAGASPKNSTRLFVGLVMDVQDDPSGKIGKVKFSVQINSNVVLTHASAT